MDCEVPLEGSCPGTVSPLGPGTTSDLLPALADTDGLGCCVVPIDPPVKIWKVRNEFKSIVRRNARAMKLKYKREKAWREEDRLWDEFWFKHEDCVYCDRHVCDVGMLGSGNSKGDGPLFTRGFSIGWRWFATNLAVANMYTFERGVDTGMGIGPVSHFNRATLYAWCVNVRAISVIPGYSIQGLIGMLGSGASKGDGPGKEKKAWKPKKAKSQQGHEGLLRDIERKDAEIQKLKDRKEENLVKLQKKREADQYLRVTELCEFVGRVQNLDVRYGHDVRRDFWRGLNTDAYTHSDYDHVFKFRRFCKSDPKGLDGMINLDLRADGISVMDLKHYDGMLVVVSYTNSQRGYLWNEVKKTELVVSVEALMQLCSPNIMNPLMDVDVVMQRLKYSAQSMYTVNENRFRYIMGEFPIANAVLVAYALFMQSKAEIDLSGFLTPRPLSWDMRACTGIRFMTRSCQSLTSMMLKTGSNVLDTVGLLSNFEPSYSPLWGAML